MQVYGEEKVPLLLQAADFSVWSSPLRPRATAVLDNGKCELRRFDRRRGGGGGGGVRVLCEEEESSSSQSSAKLARDQQAHFGGPVCK